MRLIRATWTTTTTGWWRWVVLRECCINHLALGLENLIKTPFAQPVIHIFSRTQISCMWDDVKLLRADMEKKATAANHFRIKLLTAIYQMQSALGITDLGQFYHRPLKDSHGTVVFSSILRVKVRYAIFHHKIFASFFCEFSKPPAAWIIRKRIKTTTPIGCATSISDLEMFQYFHRESRPLHMHSCGEV